MLKSDPLKYRDLKDLELVTRKTQLPKKKNLSLVAYHQPKLPEISAT